MTSVLIVNDGPWTCAVSTQFYIASRSQNTFRAALPFSPTPGRRAPMDRQPEKPEVRAGALRESCEDGAASSCHPSFELEETRAVLWDYGAVYRVAVSFCGLATSFLR